MADLSKELGLRADVLYALVHVLDHGVDVHVETFTVQRTNERKGFRDARPYANTSPYQSDPKTRVCIEIEAPDDSTGDFQRVVNAVKELEIKTDRSACVAKVEQAKAQLEQAQQEYARVKAEFTDPATGVHGAKHDNRRPK